jgi:hypothetical protein
VIHLDPGDVITVHAGTAGIEKDEETHRGAGSPTEHLALR